MIKIKTPNNNIAERKYILDILFDEFLGLSFEMELGSKEYEIELKNKKVLIIKDTFFNNHPNDLEYLKLENIPQSIEELDIFAASFFMLSRWEEYVNKNRDSHNRFPAYESLAYKQDFLDRPIVNEYIEELKNMLLELDGNLKFKIQNYQLVLTHDVDVPLKYTSLKSGLKEIVGDTIKRKNVVLSLKKIIEKMKTQLKFRKDPFDTFEYLMDISEQFNIKSYFFFMGKGLTKFDNMYNSDDEFIETLIEKIKNRGHYIGIHPTYDACNNKEQFIKEKQELEKNLKTAINFGRQHYLRFGVPNTWQIWEDNNMSWDSTLCFADREGFRSGVCYEYSAFNILTRKKLKLKERPLIVMDSSLLNYQTFLSDIDMQNRITSLIKTVKKYQGEFILLWHNSNLESKKNRKLFEDSIQKAYS